MSQRVFAVFDVGTTGARSCLIDEEGRELSKAYEQYPPIPRELKTHEQLAETYWRTAVNTTQRALAGHPSGAQAVVAVVLATTRDCITPIDRKGLPLAPTVTWVDNRSTAKSKAMAAEIGPQKTVHKLMWFIENKPDLFKKAYKFVALDAFLNYRLCGAMVTDPAGARYGPIDYETLKWSQELCQTTGIPMDKLTDIVAPGSVIGEVSVEAAKATGLRKGTIVVMGSGDQQCSALGTGTIKSGIVKATTGTGTFVVTPTDGHIDDPYVMFSNPAAIPGKWILEGVLPGTGLAYKWYIDQYCEHETAIAAQTNRDLYEVIEDSARTVPAGSDGVVVFPFFAYGRGIIDGLNFSHTKAHLARAIMESNGYGIKFYIDAMQGLLDLEFEELRIDGGGANSPLWRQIQADCANKPVVLPRCRDSTAVGAAVLAAVGTGAYNSYDEAIENMLHIEERREPIPENVAVYEQRYGTFNKILMAEMSGLLEATS